MSVLFLLFPCSWGHGLWEVALDCILVVKQTKVTSEMGNLEKKKITADTDKEKNKLLSIPSVHDLDSCTDIGPGYKSSNCG